MASFADFGFVCGKCVSGFGSLITFETGSLENANAMLRRLKICVVGESLGGVETLVSHPATMTHAAIGEAGRAKIGRPPSSVSRKRTVGSKFRLTAPG